MQLLGNIQIGQELAITFSIAVILIVCVCLMIGFMCGYMIGQTKESGRVLQYCEENNMNLPMELLRDLYPQYFWKDGKQKIK